MEKRPDIDTYFLKIASVVAERSTCLRHKVGAIIVRNKHIVTTGYNGAPRGTAHCIDVGCLRDELKIPSGTRHEVCRAVHAEQNAIIQAALHGVSTDGGTMYCTHQPCVLCAKMMINAGIGRLVFAEAYPDRDAVELLGKAGVEVVSLAKKGSARKK